MNDRPENATRFALKQLLVWLEGCTQLGWSEDMLPELEKLWWKHHDAEGKSKKV